MKKDALSLAIRDERFDASSAIAETRSRMLLSVEEAERKELFAWRFGSRST